MLSVLLFECGVVVALEFFELSLVLCLKLCQSASDLLVEDAFAFFKGLPVLTLGQFEGASVVGLQQLHECPHFRVLLFEFVRVPFSEFFNLSLALLLDLADVFAVGALALVYVLAGRAFLRLVALIWAVERGLLPVRLLIIVVCAFLTHMRPSRFMLIVFVQVYLNNLGFFDFIAF